MSKRKRKEEEKSKAEQHGTSPKKLKREHREKSGNQMQEDRLVKEVATKTLENGTDLEGHKSERKGQRNKKQIRNQTTESLDNEFVGAPMSSWIARPAVGGLQLDLDPVFAFDEEHMLLAYHDSIRVYASATSLLVRSLKLEQKSKISSFHLSRGTPTQLYVCFNKGNVQLWDWKEGSWLQSWDVKSRILDSCCGLLGSTDPDQSDVLISVDKQKEEFVITAHQLQGMPGIQDPIQKTLYRTDQPISMLWTSNDGFCIVATSRTQVIVGHQQKKQTAHAKSLDYKWWEFSAVSTIQALDARISEPTIPQSKTRPPPVDVVVGCQDGTIHCYSDIISNLTELEKSQQLMSTPNSILHWHRDAVGAVRWSKDGNYLISGGGETVLVLWQLDTGGRNFLPHLSSPIKSIVVSPSGTSYAIRLADNSTMVISTQELKPTVNIPGLVLPSTAHSQRQTRLSSKLFQQTVSRRPAVALSKSNPPQMLIATPAVASFNTDPATSRSAAYLQTIDARSGTHLARQALTRTKITDRNMGPDGFVIDEPNVVLLQVSSDGKWLATVEEWYPPLRDLNALGINEKELMRNQSQRLETSLRFWAWNPESSVWELVNRIDKPHPESNGLQDASDIVLDLVADPSSVAFVTLGDDCAARIWRPRTRYRNNIPVRDTEGETLVNWNCRQIIRLPPASFVPRSDVMQRLERIALSEDGSVLVVGRSSPDPVAYLVDVRSSEIMSIRTDMVTDSLKGLAVLGHYLVVLADRLAVWDLVDSRLAWALKLEDRFDQYQSPNSCHLITNNESGTFAISLMEDGAKRKLNTHVAIFDPGSPNPLLVSETRQTLLAIVSARQQQGFYAIDEAAQVLAFTPSTRVEIPKDMEPVTDKSETEEMTVATGLDAIFGKKLGKDEAETEQEPQIKDSIGTTDRDLNHVRQHQLNELFAYTQPFALPPVTSLFEQVAELIAGVEAK